VGGQPPVALDRREADAEGAGGFGFGHAAFDGGYYLFAQALLRGPHEEHGRTSIVVGQQL
jgi:hypothetical protein